LYRLNLLLEIYQIYLSLHIIVNKIYPLLRIRIVRVESKMGSMCGLVLVIKGSTYLMLQTKLNQYDY
jgi:hypothetical protein